MQNGSSLPITASFVHLTEAEGSALRSHLGRLGCKLLGALRRRDGSSSIHTEGTPRLRRRQPATLASSSASPLCSSRELEGANGRSSVARGEVKSVAWGLLGGGPAWGDAVSGVGYAAGDNWWESAPGRRHGMVVCARCSLPPSRLAPPCSRLGGSVHLGRRLGRLRGADEFENRATWVHILGETFDLLAIVRLYKNLDKIYCCNF